jgi:hypothetical protein
MSDRACTVIIVTAVAITGAACGGAHGPGKLRFRNAPPVTLVNDRKPAPEPKYDQTGLVQYYFRDEFAGPMIGVFRMARREPSADVNSLGNVPDSTWFVNRSLSPEDVRHGPGRGGGPDRSAAWRVDGVKVGGTAIGFTIKDARDERYILKFDRPAHPEVESSADVIVQRLTWAFGYNVPENNVVEIDCDSLALADDAKFEDLSGNDRPMTKADLDRFLAMVRPPAGACRALASRFIAGTPVGGITPSGVREDDPNDTIPHERRRVLRGQRMLWAWVDHVDLKPANSFVAYDKQHRHLVHYFLDFGESLGAAALMDGAIHAGHETTWGLRSAVKSLVTLGLWVPPWERKVPRTTLRGVGYFAADNFDPARWTASHRWVPNEVADRHDQYWAGVIIMKLTPAHVRAAVEAGRYSDPRATEHVVKVLLARQQKLGRWAFSRVAPFEDFAATGARGAGQPFSLCFDDLWIKYAFGRDGATDYRATVFDFAGRARGTSSAAPRTGSQVCVPELPAGGSHDDYAIVRIAGERGDDDLPAVFVHLARGRDGAMAVIGVDRR